MKIQQSNALTDIVPDFAPGHRAQAQPGSAPTPRTSDRPKRGIGSSCLPSSEFRECRGGDALKDGASNYVKFDQMDYKRTRNGNQARGSCEGIVREAMRRLDRNEVANLMDAVTSIRSDANIGREFAQQMFDRIDRFQSTRRALALNHFDPSASIRFDPSADRHTRIEGLLSALSNNLRQPGDMAIVRLGFYQRGATSSLEYGHALLVQRNPGNGFTVFDPNNGAFAYLDEAHAQRALRGYLDSAFAEAGFQAIPDNIQAILARRQNDPAPVPTEVPMPAVNLPEPRWIPVAGGSHDEL